jgi:sugar phosphate isomerase/epimerase
MFLWRKQHFPHFLYTMDGAEFACIAAAGMLCAMRFFHHFADGAQNVGCGRLVLALEVETDGYVCSSPRISWKGRCFVTDARSPADAPVTLPIGLCVYGIAYTCGFAGRGTPRANPNALDAKGFLDLAAQLGLAAIELPFSYIHPQEDEAALRAYIEEAEARGLRVVSAGLPIETEPFRHHLALCQRLGIKTVRCVLSTILCGDRRPIGGLEGWQRHLDQKIAILKEIAPIAEDAGVRIGVENHQDATSADLVYLCQSVNSPNVGVTLDTGNPLAVGEDPVIFARTILPYLVHVHLKDYRMTPTPEGYRIFHCAIGAGVVDYPALFELFRTKEGLVCNIEMAALGERHIRLLTDEYWAGHVSRPVADVLPVLRMRDCAEVDVEWRTAWELEQDSIMASWEMERLVQSVANMQHVAAGGKLEGFRKPASTSTEYKSVTTLSEWGIGNR